MTFRNALIALAALSAALLAAPDPARALNAGCLWDNLPADVRPRLIEQYRTGGFQALFNLQLSETDFRTWPEQCGVTEQNSESAGFMMGAYLVELGAEEVLFETQRVPRGALARAYDNLSPGDRATWARFIDDALADRATDGEAARLVLERFARAVGADPADKDRHVFAYLFGHDYRVRYETPRPGRI